MKDSKRYIFFVISFLFYMASNFAHPVTPTLIVERQLDSSLFGVALAAMMTTNFLFSPFWGKLCAYVPTKKIFLIGAIGYSLGQVIFGFATNEAMVIGGRMFAGIFTGGAFTAMSNYAVNTAKGDMKLCGQNLVIIATFHSLGGACGFFVGGMLGILSVEAAFAAQVITLSACGAACFLLCHDDTPFKARPEKALCVKDANPFSAFLAARSFMTPLLLLIFLIVAIGAIGQNSYEQCFQYYLKDQFGMSSVYNGTFKAIIAGLTLLLNSTVCMYLQKKTDINKTFLYVIFFCTALLFIILVIENKILFIAIYIIYSGVNAVRLPLLQSMAAERAVPENSNSIMGFYQSMTALGGIFGALFAGIIYSAGPKYPFILAFAAFLLSGLIGIVYIVKNRK